MNRRHLALFVSLKSVHGFTMIEILLATLLLVGGMVLAFATLHVATMMREHGQLVAAEDGQMRTLSQFFRKSLIAAAPLSMGIDSQGSPIVFEGDAHHMRFVSDLPIYVSQGGTYVYDVRAVAHQNIWSLDLRLNMVQNGHIKESEQAQKIEVIADNLEQATFRYRGWDSEYEKLGPWKTEWDTHDRLPILVEIRLQHGASKWPPVIVALPLALNPEVGT